MIFVKNRVLRAWELSIQLEFNSNASKSAVFDLEKQVSSCLSFSRFFHNFWYLFGGLWVSFGGLLEPLSFLWRVGVILLGALGLPGLSVGSLCYFLWCL